MTAVVQSETRAPVLPGDPGFRQDDTGAELPVDALDETDGAAFTIDGADQIRIVADKTNNAILVWATPVDYRMVVSVLRKLDQVPLQVLIEATIAEVTLDDDHVIDARLLAPTLEYVKKWAPELWSMAFQGPLHLIPKKDFGLIEDEMRRGRTRPHVELTPDPRHGPAAREALVGARAPARASGDE